MAPMKTRRWMKTAIETAANETVALPWARGQRRRPAAMKPAVQATSPMGKQAKA